MHKLLPNFFIFLDHYSSEIFKNKNTSIGIIYRNYKDANREKQLIKIAKECKKHRYKLFVSNDLKLAQKYKADGVYVPSFNKTMHFSNLERRNILIIGSAHNIKELNIKLLQGCSAIIFSRLFKVSHPLKKGFLGIIKFNLFKLSRKENLVPLGGINLSNLTKLKMVRSNSFALLSEIKKKPAKLFNRLF